MRNFLSPDIFRWKSLYRQEFAFFWRSALLHAFTGLIFAFGALWAVLSVAGIFASGDQETIFKIVRSDVSVAALCVVFYFFHGQADRALMNAYLED